MFLSADSERGPDGTWTNYIQPDVKIKGTGASAKLFTLHRDHLSSVRLVLNDAGNAETTSRYTPYGAEAKVQTDVNQPHTENKGYIGERADAELGLSYLNFRASVSQFATSRYPTPGSVMMKVGSAASSPSLSRRWPMTMRR